MTAILEIVACVLALVIGGFLVLLPADDYRINAIGALIVVGSLAAMVWKATRGSASLGKRNRNLPAGTEAPNSEAQR